MTLNNDEESDEAINFEDFPDDFPEAPVDNGQVASVLASVIINEYDEADLIMLPKMLKFAESLHPLGIKEELVENTYNDANDTCNGCNKEFGYVKQMVACEEKGCSQGGWWCTECQPSFEYEKKRFEKSLSAEWKKFEYTCKTEDSKRLHSGLKYNLIEMNLWACESCANKEQYVEKYNVWSRVWKRKVELAIKKAKAIDKKLKEEKEKRKKDLQDERRIKCPHSDCPDELTIYMGPWIRFGKMAEKKHKKVLQNILKKYHQTCDDDKLMATSVMQRHLDCAHKRTVANEETVWLCTHIESVTDQCNELFFDGELAMQHRNVSYIFLLLKPLKLSRSTNFAVVCWALTRLYALTELLLISGRALTTDGMYYEKKCATSLTLARTICSTSNCSPIQSSQTRSS